MKNAYNKKLKIFGEKNMLYYVDILQKWQNVALSYYD